MAKLIISANKPIRINITVDQITVAVMFALTLLTGLFNQTVLSFGIIACCTVLLFCNKLYLAFPFIMFYNSFYGLLLGFSVLRAYTLLMLLNVIMWRIKSKRIKAKYLPPFFVYLLFLVCTIMPNTSQAFPLLLEILCCFFLVTDIYNHKEALAPFFKIYAVLCLCSYVTGIICENKIGNEYNYIRFNATFEDPNYVGFFFTVGIFALITLKLFHPIIRYLLVVVIYTMMLASLSVTAIVVNILVWVFYLFFIKKMKTSVFIASIVAVTAVLSLFAYGVNNPDAPVIGDFAERINEKIEDLEAGNLGDATSGRTKIAKENFAYYTELSLFKILFGGTSVNSRYIHPDIRLASHNEYIDMLLNVGVFGALIMLGFFIYTLFVHIKEYRRTKSEQSLCYIVSKIIWLCYATALTMFIDYRFMFIFLI